MSLFFRHQGTSFRRFELADRNNFLGMPEGYDHQIHRSAPAEHHIGMLRITQLAIPIRLVFSSARARAK